MRVAIIGNLLVGKIMSLGPFGNAGLQSAFNRVARQIVSSGVPMRPQKRPRVDKTISCQHLKSAPIHLSADSSADWKTERILSSGMQRREDAQSVVSTNTRNTSSIPTRPETEIQNATRTGARGEHVCVSRRGTKAARIE